MPISRASLRFAAALLIVLASTFTVRAQPAGSLVITPLTKDFYIYTTWRDLDGVPFPANGMYVVTTAGVIMIDTPWDVRRTEPLLDSIERRHGRKVVLCIATHFHDDRTGGFDVLRAKGIPTYVSSRTQELAKQKGEKLAEHVFNDDTTFVVGGVRLDTYYPGAGHTADNIVVWFPKRRVLYGGCFVKSVESGGLGYTSDADIEAWPVSIRNVMRRCPRPRFIIPGHQAFTSVRALRHTLRLLEQKQVAH